MNATSSVATSIRAAKILLDTVLICILVGFLILFGLQFPHPHRLDTLWLIEQIRRLGDPLLGGIAAWFKWEWPSKSISLLPVGAAFTAWAIKRGVDAGISVVQSRVAKSLPDSGKAGSGGGVQSSLGISVKSLLARTSFSESARQKLMRRRKRIEDALKAVKRRPCAFLSVDVVGSTKMKVGQDPRAITTTFRAYEEMLKGIFEESAAWKQAWTPDGVLVCFQQLDHGVRAAQQVLGSLKEFNSSRNRLPTPFRVRCGLSQGEVAIFDDSKLEKVTDPVIDLAGQLQKLSRPNALCVSAEVHDALQEKSGFRRAEDLEGSQIFEWSEDTSAGVVPRGKNLEGNV